MEFLFDTANIQQIKTCGDYFPYTGVTSNPSILKAEGKVDFFAHFREIRQVIGQNRTLHIQTLGEDCNTIIKEADAILSNVDEKVYIKVPTTQEGLKAIQILKKRGIRVTATAIYTTIQGFMAICAGADFIAPYCNRMENQDIDSCGVVGAFAQMIQAQSAPTKILAASFNNIAQVNRVLLAGAQAVTLQPQLLHDAFAMPSIQQAVDTFASDWATLHTGKTLLDL